MLKVPEFLERSRIAETSKKGQNMGMFVFGYDPVKRNAYRPRLGGDQIYQLIVSDGNPQGTGIPELDRLPKWEHVSVTILRQYTRVRRVYQVPTWQQMCVVKEMLWDAEDCVIQYHPPASKYVSQGAVGNNVLHLWRPLDFIVPQPPPIFLGTEYADGSRIDPSDTGVLPAGREVTA